MRPVSYVCIHRCSADKHHAFSSDDMLQARHGLRAECAVCVASLTF